MYRNEIQLRPPRWIVNALADYFCGVFQNSTDFVQIDDSALHVTYTLIDAINFSEDDVLSALRILRISAIFTDV